MKKRTEGFLKDESISHESEQFDYISELHDYLWKFVRCELPSANGKLTDYLDIALENALHRKQLFTCNVERRFKPLSKVEIGDFVKCISPSARNENCLTKDKHYEVVNVVDIGARYGDLWFYIFDDNGRRKRYTEKNRQFEVEERETFVKDVFEAQEQVNVSNSVRQEIEQKREFFRRIQNGEELTKVAKELGIKLSQPL